MASSPKKNAPLPSSSNAEDQIALKSKVQSAINDGIQMATHAIEEVKAKVAEYDSHYQATNTAHAYLDPAISKAYTAVDELKTVADKVRESPPVQLPISLVQGAFARLNAALIAIKEQAKAYDESVKNKANSTSRSISDYINKSREQGTLGVADAQAKVHDVQELLMKNAALAAGVSIGKLYEYNDYFQISTRLAAAAGKLAEVDQRLGISSTAVAIDQRVTGGFGVAAVQKGVSLGTSGVGYVAEKASNLAIEAQNKGISSPRVASQHAGTGTSTSPKRTSGPNAKQDSSAAAPESPSKKQRGL